MPNDGKLININDYRDGKRNSPNVAQILRDFETITWSFLTCGKNNKPEFAELFLMVLQSILKDPDDPRRGLLTKHKVAIIKKINRISPDISKFPDRFSVDPDGLQQLQQMLEEVKVGLETNL